MTKNRHFMLLIIDISKHGAKEMGHVKMAGPGFVNDVTHDDPVLFQKTLRTNRNQSLYFLWNNIEYGFFNHNVHKWIQFKVFNFQH